MKNAVVLMNNLNNVVTNTTIFFNFYSLNK